MPEHPEVGVDEITLEVHRLFRTCEDKLERSGRIVYGRPGDERLVVASLGYELTDEGRLIWLSVTEPAWEQPSRQRYFFYDRDNRNLHTVALESDFPLEDRIVDGYKYLSENGLLKLADDEQRVAFRRAMQTFDED